MNRFRKIIYFILGWLFIPVILSFSTLFVFEFKKGISFWGLVYLISYLINFSVVIQKYYSSKIFKQIYFLWNNLFSFINYFFVVLLFGIDIIGIG